MSGKNQPSNVDQPKNDAYLESRQECDRADDVFIDEALIRLCKVIFPRLWKIAFFSILIGAVVGGVQYLKPRAYQCKAIITPDLMHDAIDLVQYKITDESSLTNAPFIAQLSQLKTLATSYQVKKEIIAKNQLMEKWKCPTELDCLNRLSTVYKVNEVRNVGLEISVQSPEGQFALDLVKSGIDQTNNFFVANLKKNALESVKQINIWISDVTQEIRAVSGEFIKFASDNNITDLQKQFLDGVNLLSTIKNNIVIKEMELAQKSQEVSPDSYEILPLTKTIDELKKRIDDVRNGTDPDRIYPSLSRYHELLNQYEDYQNRLKQLRERADLFTKRLATVELDAQRNVQSLMILDEPNITPVSKGTVKKSVLAMMGVFFILCFYFIITDYFKVLLNQIKNSDRGE